MIHRHVEIESGKLDGNAYGSVGPQHWSNKSIEIHFSKLRNECCLGGTQYVI